MPDDLTKEEFFEGISIPRNRELMRVFRDLEIVEQLGSGVPRILRSYGKDCFQFMDSFIRISFPAARKVGLVDGLVDSQRKIVELIISNPEISKKEMAINIGISTTAVDKHIRALRESNIIRRLGGARNGYWAIVDRV
ncbi:winged helix-turn-helix transcriptional regulator [Arachidicoccus terrestris]|uniref:winged helix-turn-helix transcriptional regulator n=1 Tax=Arachidicoccus terrestris TaxID=2875539 RepID=UPI001CC74EE3|nr:winged helix-turn-helix transcriptional regulator [Arachidicoccus terrestris]UAY55848.1 winged helix-turn-helix transcriptional regulator [Arachidicoccus terrestris]